MERWTRREALAAGMGAALAPGLLLGPPPRRTRVDALRELERAVRGPVSRPPDSRGIVYDERWESARPRAVVQALDTADVQAVVRWAARTGIPLAVRSGGHSYGGWSTRAHGVVLDLRRLDRVSVHGDSATIGPGATLWRVYSTLARHHARVPAGSCPTVGFGGLALGGGMGLAGRELGLTADNVRALRVVTAEGRVRVADALRERDLFWSLRGGGGAFGVVTAFTVKLHRAAPAAWFTASWSDAAAGLAAWQAWAPHTDPRCTSILSLSGGTASAVGQFGGPESQLRALLRPLRAATATGTSSHLDLVRRWANCGHAGACSSPRTRFAAASAYVATPLDAGGRAAFVAAARGRGGFLLDAYGGALNRPGHDATAFVHRDALFSVQALTYFGAGETVSALSWLRDARRVLAAHGNGQAYQNYADPGLPTWRDAYYASNRERLEAIKATVDPERVFATGQMI